MQKQVIIPKHLLIETINGYCTARCTMCTFPTWTRKPRRMTENEFEIILRSFSPYIEHLDYLTLHGYGEPLLDKGLPEKIALAKGLGFRGIGFATNCTELNGELAGRLVEAGLDTIICSIDGIRKETHESIRIKTNFEQIVENVKRFIEIRNNHGATRVLIRFIRQKLNFEEWPAFHQEWIRLLDPDKGDDVIRFDVHNWGDKINEYEEKTWDTDHSSTFICSDLMERFIVFSDGNVGFCCADDNGFFKLGTIPSDDPIEIFNNELFTHYRNTMREGRVDELDVCKNCTIMRSRLKKTNPREK